MISDFIKLLNIYDWVLLLLFGNSYIIYYVLVDRINLHNNEKLDEHPLFDSISQYMRFLIIIIGIVTFSVLSYRLIDRYLSYKYSISLLSVNNSNVDTLLVLKDSSLIIVLIITTIIISALLIPISVLLISSSILMIYNFFSTITNNFKKLIMFNFNRKITCEKFFTYKTNTIDISGLSAGLTKEQIAGFDLKVGQFKLDPKFVQASEKLQELDLLQYSTCQTISGVSSQEKRDELLIKLAEIKMQMLYITQNPEKISDMKVNDTNDKIKVEVTINITIKEIKSLLADNKTVGKALKLLQEKLPDENATIIFLSEYNQLSEEIHVGAKTYTSPEWRGLIHRISQFIDMKCTD